MKKEDKLFDAMGKIDKELVLGAKAKNKLWLRWGTLAASLIFIVVVGLLLIPKGVKEGHIDTDLWLDTRDHKNYGLNTEMARIWPWDYLPIYEQYTVFSYNERDYISRVSYTGQSIPSSSIGEKIGKVDVIGYDMLEDKTYIKASDIYEIKGLDTGRYLAVKYGDLDKYYTFMAQSNPIQPASLGDLIEGLNLKENSPIKIGYDRKNDKFGISNEIWDIFLKYSDSKAASEEAYYADDIVMSFSMTSSVLGIYNMAWSITKEGYLFTNIEDYGYYYNIGKDAVNEVLAYVKAHKVKIVIDEVQTIIGIVTEIGEDYIKVDDSVMMKKAKDGIVFTIMSNDYRIGRYIKSGYLRVGQEVMIDHRGIYADNPTLVTTAFYLTECTITKGGSVLIPE